MNEKVLRQIIRESLVGLTESVKEKAVSKSQQRFFGMVDAYKKGELNDASKAVKDAAEGMSMKQVKDFAKTKHKGLPNHVDESVLRKMIREALEQTWADVKPKDEMDNIRLQRYHGLVEIVEYYLNQCEAGNGVELSDRQREQLEDACNKLCVFGEIGEKWANLGRSILSGNENVVEEKPFTDENVYTMDDWRRDGSLKVQIGQLIAPEVYWQLRDSVPPMSDGGCFQPGEAYDHDWRTGKALYQTFTREGDSYYRYKGLQPASRYGLTECLSDENCTIILEKYGLSDIFTLNEDGSGNIFQKFKQPLANAINKIKNTFGNKACQFVSDAIKNAQLKGRSTLYGVLTVITLLSGTLPMNAINTSDFEDSFQNNIMAATTNMTKERGITNGDELNNIKERAVDDFIRILYTLDDDVNNVYCASGVGCSENEHSAINLAKQDVLNNLKQKYGEDVVEKYGLEFKTIATQSWQEKTFVNGKPTYKSYYTAIIAAYKTINSNNPIRECVHQTLIKMLGKYTQGKVSSKEANKAIMDLANSSNKEI